jgi:uncharacterized membrane protein YvbJ
MAGTSKQDILKAIQDNDLATIKTLITSTNVNELIHVEKKKLCTPKGS